MSLLGRIAARLRSVFDHAHLSAEMDEEMREHIDRATERFLARGMSPGDARAAARREFGNLPMIEEAAREARGARWIDALAGDLRFAFRYFGRHKATTAVIVAVLAIGTGANTLIFSLIQGEFLRPAPAVPADDSHARIWGRERARPTAPWQSRGFTLAELQALNERRDVFNSVAGWRADDVVLQAGDSIGARGVAAQFVTPNYFSTLGVPVVAGMGFVNTGLTIGASPDLTAVMSHEMAIQLYGNVAAAIGQEVLVNETPLRIVGVTPPRFQGALKNMSSPALWMPMSARAEVARVSPRWLEDPALSLFAKMAPGASREQASTRVQQLVTGTLPDSAQRVGMARLSEVRAMNALPPGSASSEMILTITVFLAIGALILVVGWMNVSSLMVASAVGRRHEIAVRLSLGASRLRVMRQLVTESTVLALTSATIGATIASWLLMYFMKTEIDGIDLTPDFGTLAFTVALAVATGILFGLSPALHATRGAVASAIRDSGTGSSTRSRLQRGFVVAQIALSQPLLVLLGTVIVVGMSEYKPLSPEMSRNVITVGLKPLVQTGGPGQRAEAVDSLIPRIAARPEVLGAVPQPNGFDVRRVVVERTHSASDSVPTILNLEGTAPGWFSIVGAPVILGRDVELADSAAHDIPVVIGADLARGLFGDVSPIGRTIPSPGIPELDQDSAALIVVGVFDASQQLPGGSFSGQPIGALSEASPRVFTARGMEWNRHVILIRTRGAAAPHIPELYRFIRERAPSIPLTSMRTLEQVDQEEYRLSLQVAALAGAGGAVALLLASLGLYGVVSLAVRQRTRDIGIRIAIGATPKAVARSFLFSGVRTSVVALAIGLPLSIIALKVGLTQGVVIAPDVNPWLIGLVIAPLLVAVAAAATWMPARRASRVDPATTLRIE
jgi:putative ABC transport system permease protein